MKTRNGGILLWVIAGIAVIGTLLFIISAPFNAKTKAVYRDATQWTPKRIQADPSGYLNWAIDECMRFRARLESHRLSLLARKYAVARAHEEAEARCNSAAVLLDESKQSYRQSQDEGTWPVMIDGSELEEEELKRRIVRLNAAKTRHAQLAAEYERLKPIICLRLGTLDERLAEVDDLHFWLTSNVELVVLSQSVDEFRGLHERVSALLDMSQAVSDVNKAPAVDGVVNQHVEMAAHEKSFAAIMQE
jgi:hypothetical protein